jgi:type I restriction enzyme M protein
MRRRSGGVGATVVYEAWGSRGDAAALEKNVPRVACCAEANPGLTRQRHNANFAWLQHVTSMLTERGRAAVIMPDNVTFSCSPAERAIRAAMVEDGLVECLVALPTGLFVTTPGVRTSIWLLKKGHPKGDGVLFIDAGAFGESVSRTDRVLSKRSIERIARTYRKWLDRSAPVDSTEGSDFARHATLADLRANGHDLNVSRYTETSAEAFDEAQLIRDVRDLMARMAELAERAAQIDARLASSLREVVPWKA